MQYYKLLIAILYAKRCTVVYNNKFLKIKLQFKIV